MVIALGCSVFPDHAELTGLGGAGAAGEANEGGGSVGAAGQASSGGAEGGAAATGFGGAGAEPQTSAGAAGAAGCPTEERRFTAAGDTWIEFVKPATPHGTDPILFVVKGAEERRALLSFNLPAAPPGSTLIRAELRLHLASNADAALAERQLEVHLLDQVISEARTTWNNYDNGASQQWLDPGGDYGDVLAQAIIPALIQDGPVIFDLTSAVAEVFAADPVPLPLIVLEATERMPPAGLAFTSRQGDALGAPELLLEYCP